MLFCSKFLYIGFWLIQFHLNQKEIIKSECENRNRPELKCNGKCFLAKKLRKAESELSDKKDQQTKSVSHLKSIESILLFDVKGTFSIDKAAVFYGDKTHHFRYVNLYYFEQINPILHPPCMLLS